MEDLEDYYNRLMLKCDELKLSKFYTESLSDEEIPEMRWSKQEDELDEFLDIARNETHVLLVHIKVISEEDIETVKEELKEGEEELSFLEEPDDADEIAEKRFEITKLKRILEIYREHLGKIGLLSYGWLNNGVLYSNNVRTRWYDSTIDIELSEYGEESGMRNPEEEKRNNLKKFKEMPLEEMSDLFSEFLQSNYHLVKMTPSRMRSAQMRFLDIQFSLSEDELRAQKMVKKLMDALALGIRINIKKELEGTDQLVNDLADWFKSTGVYSPSKITKHAITTYLNANGKIMSEAAIEVISGRVKEKLNL